MKETRGGFRVRLVRNEGRRSAGAVPGAAHGGPASLRASGRVRLIANLGAVLGGRLSFGAGILNDDGLLHACVYSPNNLWDTLMALARMLVGTVERDRWRLCVAGAHFRHRDRAAQRAQADGELLDMTPLRSRFSQPTQRGCSSPTKSRRSS